MDDFALFFTIVVGVYLGCVMAIISAVWFFDARDKKDNAVIDTSTTEGLAAACNLAAEFPAGTNTAPTTHEVHVPVGDYPPPYTA